MSRTGLTRIGGGTIKEESGMMPRFPVGAEVESSLVY